MVCEKEIQDLLTLGDEKVKHSEDMLQESRILLRMRYKKVKHA